MIRKEEAEKIKREKDIWQAKVTVDKEYMVVNKVQV